MSDTKHPGGRPLKFKTVKELQEKVDAYFAECDPHWIDEVYYEQPKNEKGKYDYTLEPIEMKRKTLSRPIPYTITGLAIALDTTRDLLVDYEDKTEYSDTIKRAKMKCHNYAEEYLFTGKNVTGAIFNLKNNYDWKDRTEQELSNPDGTLNPFNALSTEELRKLAGK